MLALAVIAAMLADLATFAWASSIYPISGEANPLARLFYLHAGLAGVALLKLTMTLGVLVILARLRRLRRWAGGFAVAFTLLAAGTNLLAVAIL